MADEKPQNEGQATAAGGFVDTGTGAVEGPPAEVTYESAVNADPTGAVEGPPAEVTVTSPAGDEVTASTGAVEGPPAETTTYEWPAEAPAPKKTAKKAVSADEEQVEDKTVRSSTTKAKG